MLRRARALDWSARWLGTWVPGAEPWRAPEGSGVEIAPGSILIVQLHYNTLADQAIADQSTLEFQIADAVERPGTFIPAGDPDVHHSVTLTRDHPLFGVTMGTIGVTTSDEVEVWRSTLHMHMLGTRARMASTQDGGDEDCLVQIDDWDFNWQGDYLLEQPVAFGPGDSLQLDCWYDNSEANQPIIDGEPKVPAPVGWGEGTLDEMCLGIIYVARK